MIVINKHESNIDNRIEIFEKEDRDGFIHLKFFWLKYYVILLLLLSSLTNNLS